MKKFLVALLVCTSVNAQTINSGTSGITPATGTLNTHNLWDDGHVQVPLQFGFPFYGKTFTNSVMYDNGVVGFYAPATPTTQAVGCDPATTGYCGGNVWYSQQYSTSLGPSWNYMIAPLHTDLIARSGSVYSTQGDATQMTYKWTNLTEYYNPSNLNTFSLQIKPSGFIGVEYEKVNLSQSNASVGITGDVTKGEFVQHYWKPAGNVINNIPNWNVNGTGVDQCVVNPLSSPTCSGYTEAMCVTNPLYATTCSGYQQAYFAQQCNANPLYNPQCPGYATAYFNQQCSIDPLYAPQCPGYDNAYFNQQCSLNPLYNNKCTGYDTAYFDQQCSLNPLYSTQCSGYQQAYFNQQCTANGLYSTQCPNYQQAYFADQCNKNGLYDKQCPNYATAYATWLALQPVQTTTTTSTTTTTESVNNASQDSSGNVSVAVVADNNVNQVITTTATSASPAQAATATVPLVTTAPAATAQVEMKTAVASSSTSTEEKKDASSSNVSQNGTAQTANSSESKGESPKPTARQELQAKREAAAKTAAVEAGKNLAGKMGEAASMDQQVQIQNVVVQAMGFTPGFDAYGKAFIPQTIGYKPYSVYNNQVNVDNKRLGRGLFGPTDNLHRDMVDSQYKGN